MSDVMPPAKRHRRTPVLWLLGGIGVAAGVALAVVLLLMLAKNPEPGETPESAVEAYLTALSEADAEAALEVIDSPPDTTHMTDSVLAYSQRHESIDLIEVEELRRTDNDSTAEEVRATFTKHRSGHDPHEITFPFDTQLNEDSGLWEVHDAAVRIRRPEVGDLDLNLNAEPFEAEETYVFWWPRYELTFDQEYFEFGSPQYSRPGFESNTTGDPLDRMEVTLTSEGEDVWRQALNDEVKECLTSTQIQAGCGLDLRDEIDGASVEEDSITRSISTSVERALRAAVPEIDPEHLPFVFSRGGLPNVHVEYETADSGAAEDYESYPVYMHRPRVDMGTSSDPEVQWLKPGHSDLP